MLLQTITRRIEIDAGHRIPHHDSKCRNLHGHRYALEATIRGHVQPADGRSSGGMIMDFYDLRTVLEDTVGQWDHAFLVWSADSVAIEALKMFGSDHRTVVLDSVPTVENLARIAGVRIRSELESYNGVHLQKIKLWETPYCSCELEFDN